MRELPVMLKLAGRLCVIVGGGGTAVRRARALLACGAEVTVIDPVRQAAWDELAGQVRFIERGFEVGDVRGAFVVVIATNRCAVNAQAAAAAREAGALVNRADNPDRSDINIPAHETCGPVTVAVSTGGISASAGAKIRDELLASLDRDWPALLEVVAPYRGLLQEKITDTALRQRLLRQLTDEHAMMRYKEGGREAVEVYCRSLLAELESANPPRP